MGTLQSAFGLGRSRYFLPLVGTLVFLSHCAHLRDRSSQDHDRAEVLSIQDVDCADCGHELAHQLGGLPGVHSTRFEKRSAEIEVHFNETVVTPSALQEKARGLGYTVVVGPGQGSYKEPLQFPEKADVQWIIKQGELVDVEQYLAAGKVTLVDFYAPWCEACHELDKTLVNWLTTDATLALRRVNVADWDSPIAMKYMSEVSALPYVMVFDVKGKQVDAISGLHVGRLRRALDAAKK